LILDSVSIYSPNNKNEDIQGDILSNSFRFIYVAIGMFFSGFVSSTLFTSMKLKNSSKLKKEYFSLIMSQEQAWFDKFNKNEFLTKVQTQINAIEAGSVDKLGYVLMSISLFISGLSVSFISFWKLSLTLIAIIFVISFCAFFIFHFIKNSVKEAEEANTKAGGLAEEILYSSFFRKF